jgi:hypothetical protein
MQLNVLSLVLCSVIPMGGAAVGWYCLRGERRRASRDAQWAQAAAGLRELEEELNRVWTAELGRMRWR